VKNKKTSIFQLHIVLNIFLALAAWSTYRMVSSPPATEEAGAMGRVIESRQGLGGRF
jgi:hypothetical protein